MRSQVQGSGGKEHIERGEEDSITDSNIPKMNREMLQRKKSPFNSLRNDPLEMRFGKYLHSCCDKSPIYQSQWSSDIVWYRAS